ncbi:MAG: nuclear transport factor 2 family protein [Gammaproteobacteria bacterium]|nr:nuclear transport factor 2 family protein [Pseudomonadales bacterium]MCP5347496.1 nuclear transport factor 2 family protein [Pseudomonadales bacterium]
MISREFAEAFAAEWIDAWNSHDLDRILSHYADDFQFASPFIPLVANEPSGILNGLASVRDYWNRALERRPDLHFELVSLLIGVASLVICFTRHDGRTGAEVFEFGTGGKVIRSAAHYADR